MKLHILRLGVHNDLPPTKEEKLIDHTIDPICGAVVLLNGKENIIVDTGNLGFKDEIVDVFKYLDSKDPILEEFASEIKKLNEITSVLHLKKSAFSGDYVLDYANEDLNLTGS